MLCAVLNVVCGVLCVLRAAVLCCVCCALCGMCCEKKGARGMSGQDQEMGAGAGGGSRQHS
jgi:hypothetical protein